MGKIVAIANQKGGVGKTTVGLHLGVWLSRRKRTVVVIDADPQANMTSMLTNAAETEGGWGKLLAGGIPIKNVIIAMNGWGVALLPSDEKTGGTFTYLDLTKQPFDTVANALAPLRRLVDYTFIDMPPSKNSGFRELLYAADLALVPTQLECWSIEGVVFMARTCGEIERDHGRGLQLLGIVPNMARKGTIEHRDQLKELVELFGATVWPPIPQSIAVPTACSYGETIFDYDTKNPAATALDVIGKRFLLNVEGRNG